MRLTLIVITAVAVVGSSAACQVPTLTTVTPTLIPPITTPGPESITAIGSGFIPGQSLAYANGVPMPTTVTDPNTLTFQLANSLPQAAFEGGIAINVVNGQNLVSTSWPLIVTLNYPCYALNRGTIGFRPLGYMPGQSIQLFLEGLQPGVPFTLVADAGTPLPFMYWPPAPGPYVLGVAPGSSTFFSVIDGLGLFGPATSLGVTQFTLGGTPPSGTFFSQSFTTPNPPSGVGVSLQVVYPDFTTSLGWRVSWTRFPFNL